ARSVAEGNEVGRGDGFNLDVDVLSGAVVLVAGDAVDFADVVTLGVGVGAAEGVGGRPRGVQVGNDVGGVRGIVGQAAAGAVGDRLSRPVGEDVDGVSAGFAAGGVVAVRMDVQLEVVGQVRRDRRGPVPLPVIHVRIDTGDVKGLARH